MFENKITERKDQVGLLMQWDFRGVFAG